MKKASILVIGLVFMTYVSCKESQKEEDTVLEHKTEELIHKIKDGDMEILEIEGCEYFVYKEHKLSSQDLGYKATTAPWNCYSSFTRLRRKRQKLRKGL